MLNTLMCLVAGGMNCPSRSRNLWQPQYVFWKSVGQIWASGINGSKHSQMRELRTQHEGRPYRTLYAFDPRRSAILLIGGDKTGDDRWYEINVPIADRLYDSHLQQLRKEGLING